MTKAPQAFRTISEVSETLDVPQHVLRFWEGKFPQVKPLKRAGGRRYYRPEDIDLLRGVRTLLYSEGYTIKGVQKLIRESGARFVGELGRYGAPRSHRHLADNAGGTSGDLAGTIPEGAHDETEGDLESLGEDADGAALADKRAKLEAALTELLALRDLLRETRKKASNAA